MSWPGKFREISEATLSRLLEAVGFRTALPASNRTLSSSEVMATPPLMVQPAGNLAILSFRSLISCWLRLRLFLAAARASRDTESSASFFSRSSLAC